MIDLLVINPSCKNLYQGLGNSYAALENNIWGLMLVNSAKQAGFSVEYVDIEADKYEGRVTKTTFYNEIAYDIKSLKPKLVLFVATGQNPNASSASMQGVVDLAQDIKQLSDVKIAVVGPHVNALPTETLDKEKDIDIVFTNEGVYALINLLSTDLSDVQLRNVKGIAYRDSEGHVNINVAERTVPQELLTQDLPGMDLSNLDFRKYRTSTWHTNYQDHLTSPFVSVYTSLGCPFQCQFCLEGNTTIILADKRNKTAKQIVVGDKLLGWDEQNNCLAETEVKKVCERKASELYYIVTEENQKIKCTGEHPFYINGKWTQAKNLNIGDELWVIEGRDKVSFRMRNKNPMKDKDTCEKVSNTFKSKIASGEMVPYLSTNEGRKIIGEIARNKMLSDQNPMLKEVNQNKKSKSMIGDKNPRWKGGCDVYNKYSLEFRKELRPKIKERDCNTCQKCGLVGGRQEVHHIDYDTFNNSECNLILLCKSCHSKSNHYRAEYQKELSQKIINMGLKNCPHSTKIKSILILNGNYDVFNYECSPHNNYYANNILTHNCMINIINRDNNDLSLAADSFNKFRYWEPDHMIKWFDHFAKAGVRNIKIADELFVLRPDHCMKLCELIIERGYEFNIWAYTRVNTVKEKYLETFKKAGINWLAIGIESGSSVIRTEITKGHFKDENIHDVIGKIKNSGINVIGNYIFGLGHDDYNTMTETYDLMVDLNCEASNMYAAMALPGSPLYFIAKKEGWELPQKYSEYGFLSYDCLPSRTEHLTAAQVLKFRDEAWLKYHTNPRFLNMVEQKFGTKSKDNILQLTKVPFKRRIYASEL